jgi:hypothetical protein
VNTTFSTLSAWSSSSPSFLDSWGFGEKQAEPGNIVTRPPVAWLIAFGIRDDVAGMDTPLCREQLSTCTLAEIVELHHKNMADKKELRSRTTTLVNQRLAKLIGAEEYAIGRQAGAEQLESCARQGRLLLDEISDRNPGFRLGKTPASISGLTAGLAPPDTRNHQQM